MAAALDTSVDTIVRTRQQLVEEGLDPSSRKISGGYPVSEWPRMAI
jgi:hypothetical protein